MSDTQTAATPAPISVEKNGSTFTLKHITGSKLEGGIKYYGIDTEIKDDQGNVTGEVLPSLQDEVNLIGEELVKRILFSRIKKGLKVIYASALEANNGIFSPEAYKVAFSAYSFVVESMKTLKDQQIALLNAYMADSIGVDSSKPVSESNPLIDHAEFKRRMKVISKKIEDKSRPSDDEAEEAA